MDNIHTHAETRQNEYQCDWSVVLNEISICRVAKAVKVLLLAHSVYIVGTFYWHETSHLKCWLYKFSLLWQVFLLVLHHLSTFGHYWWITATVLSWVVLQLWYACISSRNFWMEIWKNLRFQLVESLSWFCSLRLCTYFHKNAPCNFLFFFFFK